MHKLRLAEYRRTFECGISTKEKLETFLEKGRLSLNVIGSLCTFKCPDCDKRYNSLHSFRVHTKEHHSKVKHYFFLDCLEDVVTHRCKICSKLLLSDASIIRRHVQREHNMQSLNKYAEENAVKHLLPRDFNILAVRTSQVSTKDIGNLCIFTCSVCGQNTSSWRSMKRHLNVSKHDTSFRKNLSKYLRETKKHKCLICEKLVLNDRVFLDTHMRRCHKKALSQYVNEFKLIQVDKRN